MPTSPAPPELLAVRYTDVSSAVFTIGAQRGAKLAQFGDGSKSRFPIPSSSDCETLKIERMSKLMPELKAQLRTERFGLRKVGTSSVAPRFRERLNQGFADSERRDSDAIRCDKQESNSELRSVVQSLAGVVSELVAQQTGPRQMLRDNRPRLEPVGTGEPWQSMPLDRYSSSFGSMIASSRHASDFDSSRTRIGRFNI